MTPHKLEACRAEIEMLLEYDMIEPSKSPWVLHHTGLGFCLLAGPSAEEGQRKDLIRM